MSAPVNGSPAIPDEPVAVVPELDPEVPPVEVVEPATPLLWWSRSDRGTDDVRRLASDVAVLDHWRRGRWCEGQRGRWRRRGRRRLRSRRCGERLVAVLPKVGLDPRVGCQLCRRQLDSATEHAAGGVNLECRWKRRGLAGRGAGHHDRVDHRDDVAVAAARALDGEGGSAYGRGGAPGLDLEGARPRELRDLVPHLAAAHRPEGLATPGVGGQIDHLEDGVAVETGQRTVRIGDLGEAGRVGAQDLTGVDALTARRLARSIGRLRALHMGLADVELAGGRWPR